MEQTLESRQFLGAGPFSKKTGPDDSVCIRCAEPAHAQAISGFDGSRLRVRPCGEDSIGHRSHGELCLRLRQYGGWRSLKFRQVLGGSSLRFCSMHLCPIPLPSRDERWGCLSLASFLSQRSNAHSASRTNLRDVPPSAFQRLPYFSPPQPT